MSPCTVEPLEQRLMMDATPAPDLVQFAEDLAAGGLTFYGASWCPHCRDQKETFADGAGLLPYVEASTPFGGLSQAGADAGINSFPTWTFPNRDPVPSQLTAQQLSDLSGIPIPLGIVPWVEQIDDLDAYPGSKLHIPLNGYDPNGDPLTWEIEAVVTDGNATINASVEDDGQSVIMDVGTYGKLTFQLFDEYVPAFTQNFVDAVNAGTFENLAIDQPDDGFLLETSGANGGTTDNLFNADLRHNQFGLLTTSDPTDGANDFRFAITDLDEAADPKSAESLHELDFDRAVLGIMTEGSSVFDTLTAIPDINFAATGIPRLSNLGCSMTSRTRSACSM